MQAAQISIHAPPRGATCALPRVNGSAEFQFTPLREGRPRLAKEYHTFQGISIHAPPRGATNERRDIDCKSRISIHAPPRGATRCAVGRHPAFRFQFTPLREGRRFPSCCNARPRNFNSRPSARGDHRVHGHAPGVEIFQFTPLREGRPDEPGNEST